MYNEKYDNNARVKVTFVDTDFNTPGFYLNIHIVYLQMVHIYLFCQSNTISNIAKRCYC